MSRPPPPSSRNSARRDFSFGSPSADQPGPPPVPKSSRNRDKKGFSFSFSPQEQSGGNRTKTDSPGRSASHGKNDDVRRLGPIPTSASAVAEKEDQLGGRSPKTITFDYSPKKSVPVSLAAASSESYHDQGLQLHLKEEALDDGLETRGGLPSVYKTARKGSMVSSLKLDVAEDARAATRRRGKIASGIRMEKRLQHQKDIKDALINGPARYTDRRHSADEHSASEEDGEDSADVMGGGGFAMDTATPDITADGRMRHVRKKGLNKKFYSSHAISMPQGLSLEAAREVDTESTEITLPGVLRAVSADSTSSGDPLTQSLPLTRRCSRPQCPHRETAAGDFNVCGRCMQVAYCSVSCQEVHWGVQHRGECSRLAAQRRHIAAQEATSIPYPGEIVDAQSGNMPSKSQFNPPPLVPAVSPIQMQRPAAMKRSDTKSSRNSLDRTRRITRLAISSGDSEAKQDLPLTPSYVKLVCFDMDNTILRMHTGGYYSGSMDELADHVVPSFIQLVPRLLDAGVLVSIVTFSDEFGRNIDGTGMAGEKLVRALLHIVYTRYYTARCSDAQQVAEYVQALLGRIVIAGCDPQRRNIMQQGSNIANNKNWHIDRVLTRYRLDGHHPRPEQILLFDDRKENVMAARRRGHFGYWVDKKTALTETQWREAISSLPPTTQFK